MDLQLGRFLYFLFLDMVFHVCPLVENLLALPLAHLLLRSYRCMAVKWALPWTFPLVGETKTCYTVLNWLSGVMMMMSPAQVKMMVILKTWIKISTMTALMTVTLTDQMERVRGMNLYIVMIMNETTMKKKNQV